MLECDWLVDWLFDFHYKNKLPFHSKQLSHEFPRKNRREKSSISPRWDPKKGARVEEEEHINWSENCEGEVKVKCSCLWRGKYLALLYFFYIWMLLFNGWYAYMKGVWEEESLDHLCGRKKWRLAWLKLEGEWTWCCFFFLVRLNVRRWFERGLNIVWWTMVFDMCIYGCLSELN